MKVSRAPDGDHALACGATARIIGGRHIDVFCAPNVLPSRGAVQDELLALTGLRTWLENWPSESLPWPGYDANAIVLDYDEQVAACSNLAELTLIVHGVIEFDLVFHLGWSALGVDPQHLPTFGGDAPAIPASFFASYIAHRQVAYPAALPAQALSWDDTHVLVSADPNMPPYLVPRRARSLYVDEPPASDADAFADLARMLPWREYNLVGANQFLRARDGQGRDQGYGALVSSRTREVIAVGQIDKLRHRYG